MPDTTLLVLLLYSSPLPVLSLFLSLGSAETHGIICGFYDRVVFVPEVHTSYESLCQNNCQTFIANCVKKMLKICQMVEEKELNDSFCKENDPDIYCRTSLKPDSCNSCKRVAREKTVMVARTVKKVRVGSVDLLTGDVIGVIFRRPAVLEVPEVLYMTGELQG